MTPRSEPSRPIFGRWYALATLTGIYATHSLDRNVISVVMEPVKAELEVSDAAMGVLAGIAHSAMLALFILPLGLLSDKVNRVRLISALCIIWSGLTALGATVTSFGGLLAVRLGVGAAEAGMPPASISLISDLFSSKERPTAISLYYVSAAIGTGLIFLFGGYVAEHFGWRMVFLIAGIPGLCLGVLLLLTVRDWHRELARRQLQNAAHGTGIRTQIAAVGTLLHSPALRWVVAGGTFAAVGQIAFFAWLVSFLLRVHDFSLTHAGLITAAGAGLGKGAGTLVCGPLTRRFSNDVPSRLWRYPGSVLVASVLLTWALMTVNSPAAVIALVLVLTFMLGGWAGPTTAILVAGVKPESRGSAVSLYQLAVNFIGGLGPLLTGYLSDSLGGGSAIAIAIGLTMSVNLLAAVCLAQSGRALNRSGFDASPI
ncbi:MAG: MFS transporter [Hyphomonas sp.]|nr:MFS transporter [Hyphomonas sp.]